MNTKYKSKTTYIEAILVSDVIQNAKTGWNLLPKWLTELYDKDMVIFINTRVLIPSDDNPFTYGPPKSWKTVESDQMLVLNDKGKLDSYPKDIFDKYYEKFEEFVIKY